MLLKWLVCILMTMGSFDELAVKEADGPSRLRRGMRHNQCNSFNEPLVLHLKLHHGNTSVDHSPVCLILD